MTADSAMAATLVAAISGDINAVRQIVVDAPELAGRSLGGRFGTRTALHVVADWSGYFPNGPRIVPLLIAAGADPRGVQELDRHAAASSYS
jgi:uncharacterized protein